ncbi:MAG: 1-deoxy-D-xylulose-5-phosphate synthase [Elusimicrobiales bacterium]|nr:1-deoxy-D-xylulose-5-phosphate synthase [Elusimicrobiales bacterium]
MLENIRGPEDIRKLPVSALPDLAAEVRKTIIEGVANTGGHLASSLGATDLILALHYVYNTPRDRIVFDTGHQSYAHKILTGRRDQFKTIRTKGGMSGFLKRYESEYDTFGAGHASTALSAAAGMAAARDMQKSDRKIVAVVGDGSMTGGMSWEALENIGQMRTNMLLVLNDNNMFISNSVGRLGKILTNSMTLGRAQEAGRKVELFLNRFQYWGKGVMNRAKRARALLLPGTIFEELGFTYYGPVNGNDLPSLIETLNYVKDMRGPVVLHAITKKGYGYDPAEEKPTAFHGVGKFDVYTGEFIKPGTKQPPSFTSVFSNTLVKLAEKDKRICAITAAMPEGTGTDKFRDKFPERYFDTGIAEEHAVTFAAGLAADGAKPVCAIYSSFMQRAFDQVMHDIALQKLPVVICMDRAGIVGEDGPTHHGVFDMGLFRMLPDIISMAPSDENELQNMLATALKLEKPVLLRYPRGKGFGVKLDEEPQILPLGKGRILSQGKDVNFLAIGNRMHPAAEACGILKKQGIDAGIADMRFIKPLDTEIIKKFAEAGPIITVEDNALAAGFGSAVMEYLNEEGIDAKILRLGIPDQWIEHGKADLLYKDISLTPETMAAKSAEWLKKLK